ncbi:MAG: hypothetical protein DHS20C16_01680 [Phycisphaerae bacterium]|nr:MAG: hypothetical protein DHS20C16_01680 [Phycisphaerae bacterium]
MTIIGLEFLAAQMERGQFAAKMVFNEAGAIFFPTNAEHRDQKADGISYEDDYRGNALAAMLAPQKMEIRYHDAYSDQRVERIIRHLARQCGLEFLSSWMVTYQGRRVLL